MINLFPARERLEGDISAGDGKIDNLYNSVVRNDGGMESNTLSWPERGGVDHVLGILHPDGVCDPARVGGGHVQVRVRVCVDVDLVAALQAQLIVVDTHLPKLKKNYCI